MGNRLLIVGASTYALVAKEIACDMRCFAKIDFVDDHKSVAPSGEAVVGTTRDLASLSEKYTDVIVAIGNPEVRAQLYRTIEAETTLHIATLISPRAYVAPSATLASGVIVEPMAVIHTKCTVQMGCLICAGAVVNHESTLSPYVQIDCNATVEGYSHVPQGTKVACGSVYRKRKRMQMYKHVVKRFLDIILAGIAGILLAIPMLIVALAIKIDDPGPVLFKQKRVGQKKNGEITYFMIWKFRSMKMSTPHDTPTHLLANPEQYITRVGKFIRKTSIDELPQIYQVFLGKISWVGPRPALWSQADLIAEREKYGANDVKPGITGWAQINGRDELEIDVKAKFDGEYADALNAGKCKGFAMDVKCFFGTIVSVLKHDGVVEGGTGEMKKMEEKNAEQEVTTK